MNKPRSAGLIYLVVFLDLLGFGIVIPQLGVYSKLYHASGLQQGLLIASYSMMQFLFAPLLGRWSDRIGRRPVLIISLATSLAGHILFAMSHSLTLLFASRIVDGLGGANISTAQAYLSDITPAEKRARAMGMIGAAFGMGFVLGPAAGAIVGPLGVQWWGPHGGNLAIGGLAAISSAITLLVALFRLGESLPVEERHTTPTSLRLLDFRVLQGAAEKGTLIRLLWIMLVATAGFAVLHAVLTFFIIDTLGLDVDEQAGHASRLAGYVFCWIGFLTAMVQGGLIGRLVKKHGEASLMLTGLFLMAVGLALMPTSHSLGVLFLVTTPLAIGSALNSATLPALMTFHSPGKQRGEVLGLNSSMGSIGRIIGPLLGGLLYDVRTSAPFEVGAVLCFVAMIVGFGIPRDRPGEAPVAEADAVVELQA